MTGLSFQVEHTSSEPELLLSSRTVENYIFKILQDCYCYVSKVKIKLPLERRDLQGVSTR